MEESHAKLRDRPCLEDRPSAARGLYLQGSACCSEARVLFKYFPFRGVRESRDFSRVEVSNSTSVFDTGRPVPTLATLYCICLCRSLQALVGSFPHSGQYFWLLRLGVNHTPQISHSFCFVSTSKFLLSFLVWEKYERYYCNTKSRQDKNTFFLI